MWVFHLVSGRYLGCCGRRGGGLGDDSVGAGSGGVAAARRVHRAQTFDEEICILTKKE